MKTEAHALAVFALLAAVSACSNGTGGSMQGGSPMPKTVAPSAATKAVWAKIQGYQSWPTFPENTTPKLSTAHGGVFVLAHYNDVVASSIVSHALPLADGALIVKDNFAHMSDTTPMAVTLMSKQGGQWYFVEANPDGMVITDASGAPLEGSGLTMCTMCHDPSKNDGVKTHTF